MCRTLEIEQKGVKLVDAIGMAVRSVRCMRSRERRESDTSSSDLFHSMTWYKSQVSCFQVWFLPLMFFWRGSSVVHIIREELNAVYALFGLIDYGPFEGIKRDLAFWD